MSKPVIFFRGKDYTNMYELSLASKIPYKQIIDMTEEEENQNPRNLQLNFNRIIKIKRDGNTSLETINKEMDENFSSIYEFRQWFKDNHDFDITYYASVTSKENIAKLYKLAIRGGHGWLFGLNASFEHGGRQYYSSRSFFKYNEVNVTKFIELYIELDGDLEYALKVLESPALIDRIMKRGSLDATAQV